MPIVSNDLLLSEELSLREPGRAPKFAHTFDVDYNIIDEMSWKIVNDKLVGRVIITSKKAKSINFGFSSYNMPNSSKLLIYNIDKSEIRGPFTKLDNEDHNQLWTPIVKGDMVVIELSIPSEQNRTSGELALTLSSINHDYLGFGQLLSGSCNLDVICNETDGWDIVNGYRDIIQSVAVISTGGGTFCTGFLIDNVGQDCKPFFMTADHCGINQGTAASLVTYWNFQNSTCREPNSGASGGGGDGQLNDFNTGSYFRSSYAPSDFALVELDDPVSETADAFFAGFDATGDIPTRAIGVHHPSTDEKRISFEMDPLSFTDYYDSELAANKNHVHVDDWDIGTTEPGSSGSPLFDQSKRVIGQLHGGGAACGNDDSDWYGAIVHSWIGGGTPETQLKYWLDPNNTGILKTDGRTSQTCSYHLETPQESFEICNDNTIDFDILVSEQFTETVTIQSSGLPTGVTVSILPLNLEPGESATVTISGLSSLNEGDYTLMINAFNLAGESSLLNIDIHYFNAIVSEMTNLFPIDNALSVPNNLSFSWDEIFGNSGYDLDLATDVTFNNIIFSATDLSSETVDVQDLLNETNYFWRVRANNVCGVGDWKTNMFETGKIDCSNIDYEGAPVVILDSEPGVVVSTIEILETGIINDIKVINVRGTHTWISDLTFTLISPQGVEVVLFSSICFGEDNFDINFDNNASSGNLPCPPIGGGFYMPAESLTNYVGENVQGTWQLKIEDTFSADGGELVDWGLEYCIVTEAEVVYEIYSNTQNIEKCENEPFQFNITLSNGYEGNVNLSVEDGSDVTFSPNPALANQIVQVTIGEGFSASLASLDIVANDGVNEGHLGVPAQISPLPTCVDFYVYDLDTRLPLIDWESANFTNSYIVRLYKDGNLISTWNTTETFIQTTDLLDYDTNYQLEFIQSNDCGEIICELFDFATDAFKGTFKIGDNTFKLYPIPTSSHVYLEFAKTIPFMEWVIYDMEGRLIEENKVIDQMKTDIDMTNYSSGVYILHLVTKDHSQTIKLIRN